MDLEQKAEELMIQCSYSVFKLVYLLKLAVGEEILEHVITQGEPVVKRG